MGGKGKKIDLSGGDGRRRAPPAKRVKTEVEAEARAAASRGKARIELDLGLSTNGQFGVDPAMARKLERSASGYSPSGAGARGDHAPPIRTTSVPPGFGGREEGRRGDPSGKGKAPMVYSPEGRELNGDAGANQNNMTRSSSIPQASPAAANSLSEKQKLLTNALLNMPYVTLTGARLNNIHVEGILYRYRKAEELKIVCVCHGLFLTPAEFVKHGGGGDVDDPLKYIVVNPTPIFPV